MQKIASHAVPPTGTIRLLRPSDLSLFRDHFLRLDAESRRDRFNGVTDDEFVVVYANRCFTDGTTVIGYVEDDEVLGAAELRERPEDKVPTGEIAFSVERELRHRGIGSRLNGAMRALARKFGAEMTFDAAETMGIIDLAPIVVSLSIELDHSNISGVDTAA